MDEPTRAREELATAWVRDLATRPSAFPAPTDFTPRQVEVVTGRSVPFLGGRPAFPIYRARPVLAGVLAKQAERNRLRGQALEWVWITDAPSDPHFEALRRDGTAE
jgi:hypothetical protein